MTTHCPLQKAIRWRRRRSSQSSDHPALRDFSSWETDFFRASMMLTTLLFSSSSPFVDFEALALLGFFAFFLSAMSFSKLS